MFEKIRKKIQETVKLPYYYVPPCPACKSPITGRYMKYMGETSSEWQVNESLRNGEIVEIVSVVPEENCFCCACGHEWEEDIRMRLFTLEEIEQEKAFRGTNIALNERMKRIKEERMNDKGAFRGFRRFIGKI